MSLLLDTHVLLWWLTADPRLSATAKAAVENPNIARYISSVTAFEISTKVRIGKLDFAHEIADKFEQIMVDGAFLGLDISHRHALMAGRMPASHRDPFDRLLAAQCTLEKLSLVTADR